MGPPDAHQAWSPPTPAPHGRRSPRRRPRRGSWSGRSPRASIAPRGSSSPFPRSSPPSASAQPTRSATPAPSRSSTRRPPSVRHRAATFPDRSPGSPAARQSRLGREPLPELRLRGERRPSPRTSPAWDQGLVNLVAVAPRRAGAPGPARDRRSRAPRQRQALAGRDDNASGTGRAARLARDLRNAAHAPDRLVSTDGGALGGPRRDATAQAKGAGRIAALVNLDSTPRRLRRASCSAGDTPRFPARPCSPRRDLTVEVADGYRAHAALRARPARRPRVPVQPLRAGAVRRARNPAVTVTTGGAARRRTGGDTLAALDE